MVTFVKSRLSLAIAVLLLTRYGLTTIAPRLLIVLGTERVGSSLRNLTSVTMWRIVNTELTKELGKFMM